MARCSQSKKILTESVRVKRLQDRAVLLRWIAYCMIFHKLARVHTAFHVSALKCGETIVMV